MTDSSLIFIFHFWWYSQLSWWKTDLQKGMRLSPKHLIHMRACACPQTHEKTNWTWNWLWLWSVLLLLVSGLHASWLLKNYRCCTLIGVVISGSDPTRTWVPLPHDMIKVHIFVSTIILPFSTLCMILFFVLINKIKIYSPCNYQPSTFQPAIIILTTKTYHGKEML